MLVHSSIDAELNSEQESVYQTAQTARDTEQSMLIFDDSYYEYMKLHRFLTIFSEIMCTQAQIR